MNNVDAWRIAWLAAVLTAFPSGAIAQEISEGAPAQVAAQVASAQVAAARDVALAAARADVRPGTVGTDASDEASDETSIGRGDPADTGDPADANADASADASADTGDGPGPDDLTDEELAMLEASLAADAESDADRKSGAAEPDSAESSMASSDAANAATTGTFGGLGTSLDIALILDVALAAFTDEPLQTGAHDPSQSGFNFQQLELSMGASVDPYFRLDTNLVFTQFGVEVEEAYATTLALPWNLQARLGQFLTPFGRLNPTHPHSWNFLDQPIVNGKFFGGEGSRGMGAEVSWLSPLPWFVELTAAANEATGECCARSFYGGDPIGTDGLEDVLYTTRLEQFFALGLDWGLLWGMTAQFGPNASGSGNRTEIYGTDLYLRWRPHGAGSERMSVDLTVEAMLRTRQVPDDVLQDAGTRAELVWNIDPRWGIGARHEWVSGVDDDPLDPEWTDDRQRVALQGTFTPSHFSRLRLQGAWDAPGWRDEPILGVMLGLELVAGSHGSHDY